MKLLTSTVSLFTLALALSACGGSSLSVALTSNDAEQALSSATKLTEVKAVTVTFSEVSAHIAGKDAPEDSDGGVDDADKGWVVLSNEDVTIDLMTVRNDASAPLGGEVAVPEGKITQIRLKVKGGTESGDDLRFAGAVTDADGAKCDLVLPKSAANPGIKISGVFKAATVEGSDNVATVNLKLSDSTKLQDGGCAFRLNPVLKLQSAGKAKAK